jgi:DNA/RNA-binding domain of Phe-tRNA-synthetase-like protein
VTPGKGCPGPEGCGGVQPFRGCRRAVLSLGGERLAFPPDLASNELDYSVLYAAPHPVVLDAFEGAPGRPYLRQTLPTTLRGKPTMTLTLTVSDDVRALAPGFTHVAIEAHGLVNGPSSEAGSALLDDAARRLAARLDGRAPHEDPHMAAWRETYTAFGSKPSRTRNSAEALAKRALSGAGPPRINLLVDLYNAISVAHLIPVGGEDIDRVQGGMRLVRATGEEDFVTVTGGEEAVEHPDAGEVVWRDDQGVTCRRWNWRQGPRTRLTERTTSGIFLLESMAPAPVADVEAAAGELAELLAKFSPGADIDVRAPESSA